MLKTYLRDKDNNPYGVAVAIKDDEGLVRYGYSLVNPKADRFSKAIGTKIAEQRARADINKPILPTRLDRVAEVCAAYASLRKRAKQYYK